MNSLGRVVEHDPRSRRFAFPEKAVKPATVMWEHRAPVLNQGDLGSCTGNAMAQLLNTTAFAATRKIRHQGMYLNQKDAVELYSAATHLDNQTGYYPPDDTGSSGLAVAKAAKQAGYITEYRHCFSWPQFQQAIMTQPVIVGTAWYEGMFIVDKKTGLISPTGNIVGGHEYLVLGYKPVEANYVTILNSWGPYWGFNGRARIRSNDFRTLLEDQGDVTVPVGVAS